MKNKNGFTLIELLIVIAIIGILAAIAIPKLLNAINKARVNSMKSDISSIRKAIEMYASENVFPASGIDNLRSVLIPEFMGEIPINPWRDNATYSYVFDETTGDYTISGPLFDEDDGYRTLFYYSRISKFTEIP